MALTQLLFKKQNLLADIELDAVIREGVSAVNRVTNIPVENGADTNDHIIVDPLEFFMDGVISNVSSSLLGQLDRTTIFSQDLAKIEKAWEDMLNLMKNRVVFSLIQGLRTYENVTITRLTSQNDSYTANALFFTASMREIILVGAKPVEKEQFNEPSIADQMIDSVKSGLKQLKTNVDEFITS
jgi:hypothetical protein